MLFDSLLDGGLYSSTSTIETLPSPAGPRLAAVLATSWRERPLPLDATADELEQLSPLLVRFGCAALVWWRLRDRETVRRREAEPLQLAFFKQARWIRAQESELKQTLSMLNRAGIEALVYKGWAAARMYPRVGLRPAGDIDLIIRRSQRAAAENVLANVPREFDVDLAHQEIDEMDDQSVETIFARSQLVPLDGEFIRVLSPEDGLRLLALHCIRHYVCRPLWLCDVAAAVEARPARFDWEYCLRGDRRQRNWITTAIALAGNLLSADTADTPRDVANADVPRFLRKDSLRFWSAGQVRSIPDLASPSSYLRAPRLLARDLRDRWPLPVEAIVNLRKPFGRTPFPAQLQNLAANASRRCLKLISRRAVPSDHGVRLAPENDARPPQTSRVED